MSRNDSNIPPELRSALEREFAGEEGVPNGRRGWEEVWELLDRAAPSDASLPDAEETWEGVRRHIEEEASRNEEERRGRRRRPLRSRSRRQTTRRRLWRWGSVVATLLVLVTAVWWWNEPVEVTAAPGTTVTRTLPDGSVVELNAGTRLTYSRSFSAVSMLEADRRVVRLRGEAYFEVEPGGRPFVVRTATARVEVVGTAFSVRSRAREGNETQVVLAEGQLRVANRTGADAGEVTLRPGQAVTVGENGPLTAVRDTSIRRVLAWRRGGFAVTGQPLPVLAEALERRFGQSIRLDSSISEATRSDPLTLYYSQSVRLDNVLHDVCMARGLTYRATASGYVLSKASSPQSTP